MQNEELTLMQACRVFFAFFWRFAMIAGVLGAGAYFLGNSLMAQPESGYMAASLKAPIVPGIALIILMIAGTLAIKMTLDTDFGDFYLSPQSEQQQQSRSSIERHLHSNPLSRNPTTARLHSSNRRKF